MQVSHLFLSFNSAGYPSTNVFDLGTTVDQAFKDWWGKTSKDTLPVLVGVTHWGSSVDDWQPIKKDAIYYEAYKKSHRAPHDEFGRIIDVPGPLLERFSDIL